MVQAWRNGAKVVQMVRTQTEGAGFFKALTSRGFYRFVNMLSETPVVSGAADYQLLDRVVVDAVLRFRDRYPFVRGLVAWLGFPATRIEYVATERRIGKSGYTLRKMVRLSLQAVMGLSSKPLRLSFYFGLLTAIFCVLYGGFAIVALAAGKTVQGWTSVIVMVTFLGGSSARLHGIDRRISCPRLRSEPRHSQVRDCGGRRGGQAPAPRREY